MLGPGSVLHAHSPVGCAIGAARMAPSLSLARVAAHVTEYMYLYLELLYEMLSGIDIQCGEVG